MVKVDRSALRHAKEQFAVKQDTSFRQQQAEAKAVNLNKMEKLRALRIARDAEQEAANGANIKVAPAKTAKRLRGG